jgi:hypothetical protein
MKQKIIIICQLANMLICQLNAQSVSPQVIASSGGYQSNTAGSLSFTIGETNTKTLSSANNMLTQGFQQPYYLNLNLKAYLQGYYLGAGLMENVLFNQGVTVTPGNKCDTIIVQLRQATSPYAIAFTTKQVLQTNGQVAINGLGLLGQSYYVVIKHRNTVETWSANPIVLNESTSYDFSSASSQAYGSNQREVESGVWALYNGDLNQDENIDLLDIGLLENDINAFQFGYFATDINGDGNVDLLDAPIVEGNVNAFVFSIHP